MSQETKLHKGRGATHNQDSRFNELQHQAFDDGWGEIELPIAPLKTTLLTDTSRSVITYNQSPDLPFDHSINPYRGCEHGCPYCYARPSHAYLGLSPGLDFESRLVVKPDLINLLKKELGHRKYQCQPLALGTNTDPYQPIEKQQELTRNILELMLACSHPVYIVTKSALIERDIDILKSMTEQHLVQVALSITTLDKTLARKLEPRAASPARRLKTLNTLAEAGIPVTVMLAPVIPQLNDSEIETILTQSANAGCCTAKYILLRLPNEVLGLFSDWLFNHYPLKAQHVLNTIQNTRNGKMNDSEFGRRQRGQGAYADMIRQRFELQCRRLKLNTQHYELNCNNFKAPQIGPKQLSLFDFME